jgi:hypothetical protein
MIFEFKRSDHDALSFKPTRSGLLPAIIDRRPTGERNEALALRKLLQTDVAGNQSGRWIPNDVRKVDRCSINGRHTPASRHKSQWL